MAICGNLQMLSVIILALTSATIFRTATCNRCNRRCGLRPQFPQVAPHRIIGGRRAKQGEIPWQVYIHRKLEIMLRPSIRRSLICGGSIINERWILTAAHCFHRFTFQGLRPYHFLVTAGNLNRANRETDPNSQVREIHRWFLHDRYNNDTGNNDIALLELRRPLVYNNHAQPICLARDGDHFTGMTCTASGWGLTKHTNAEPSLHLNTVQLPVINMETCMRHYPPRTNRRYAFAYTNVCTLYPARLRITERAVCKGDSGGPLGCLMEDGRFVQAGVMSTSSCNWKIPDIHVRVSAYFGWIHEITGVDFD